MINEEQKKPKTHKPFQHLHKSCPIIDTMNILYHGIRKFLTALLNPYSFAPNCREGGSNCKFWEKNPQGSFNYYKRMT